MTTDRPSCTPPLPGSPHDVPDKARRIRRMFNGIAPRYELVNSLFSGGRDAAWRRKAVQLAAVRSDDTVLDVACGTGDFARAFAAARPRLVVGCDFAHEMLKRAVRVGRCHVAPGWRLANQVRRPRTPLCWCEADALRLPFPPETFSITSCAFGVRNFADLDRGLGEMLRVLKPGGRAVILEFTRPGNRVARRFYELYSTRFMPLAATLLSGDRSGAYRYLPRSVVSFLSAEQMFARLGQAGFAGVKAIPLTMGIVTVYLAVRE